MWGAQKARTTASEDERVGHLDNSSEDVQVMEEDRQTVVHEALQAVVAVDDAIQPFLQVLCGPDHSLSMAHVLPLLALSVARILLDS